MSLHWVCTGRRAYSKTCSLFERQLLLKFRHGGTKRYGYILIQSYLQLRELGFPNLLSLNSVFKRERAG